MYVISLNDDGFAYQRSAEGAKSHTLLPKNTINDLLIIYYLLFIYSLFIFRMLTQFHYAYLLLHRICRSLHSPSPRFSFTLSFDSIFVPRLVSCNFNTQFSSTSKGSYQPGSCSTLKKEKECRKKRGGKRMQKKERRKKNEGKRKKKKGKLKYCTAGV